MTIINIKMKTITNKDGYAIPIPLTQGNED